MALLAFAFTNAQEVKYGVKFGGNLSNLRVNVDNMGTVVFKSNVGFQAGGFAEVKVADKFSVQPEALFSYESSEVSGVDFNLSYINVPVMVKFYASEKINLQVGPQIGFIVGAKAKMDGQTEDIKDSLKTTNFGLNFGLGYNLTEKVLVDLRYNVGLTEISENGFEGGKMKLSGFSLALGYKF